MKNNASVEPQERISEIAKQISIAHGYAATLRHCINATINDRHHTGRLLEMIAEIDNNITRLLDHLMSYISAEIWWQKEATK